MSSGKSDQDIIAEQAVSLDSKSRSDRPEKFSDRSTVTSDESNVNESNLQEFEGVNVSTGRTGQNGGGTNAQLIPPEEGGEGVAGTSSAIYDDARGGKSDIQADIHRNNPGVSRTGDNPNIQKETGIAGARPAQELEDQPRSSAQA